MNAAAGPKPRWITGHLREFRNDRLGFFTRCAREYGDIVPLRLLRYRILLISRPDLIEQVLVTQSKNFVKHFGLRLYKPLFGQGLVTSEGDVWRRQRKLSAPAFQASRLASYADAMAYSAAAMLDRWRSGQVREIHADMTALTLQIACKTLFGADVCPDPALVSRAVTAAMEALALRWKHSVALPWWIPTAANRRFKHGYAALRAIVLELILRRRSAGLAGDDLLSALLAARDEDGSAMSEQQLLDELITLFLAGHETTALALTYTLYLLAANPPVQARLAAELDHVLAGRPPRYEDIPRLPFARNVLTESLRLYPPADFLGREAIADCTIGDLRVPRGTNLFMSQWVMHHDPRFFPDPDRFDPDRWTPDFERSLPRFAYFPFGGGPRYCIGQTFATAEATLILAVLLQRFSLTIEDGFHLEVSPRLTLRPRGGVRLVVQERHTAPPPATPPEALLAEFPGRS